MSLITPERLVKLAYGYPSLQNNWYLIACSCLTVINKPEEIPKIFHFALRQQLLEYSTGKNLLADKYLIQLAQDSIYSSKKYEDLSAVGVNLPDVRIPFTYHEKLPLAYRFSRTEDIQELQKTIASKFREVILKSSGLSGLPKAINAMMLLKAVTPTALLPSKFPQRSPTVCPGKVNSSKLLHEDVHGTRFEEDKSEAADTIDGPISPESVKGKQIYANLVRGSDFWNSIYTNKVNTRVRHQMLTSYPDLWYFAYHHIYSPLFSFTDVLSAAETSMCIVAALIPQDVNPQLKGHLRGALNIGISKEEISALRQLVVDVCDWSGGNYWIEGKESIAKL